MNAKSMVASIYSCHWLQYGMKTLLLAMTVVCLLVGVLSGKLRQARAQHHLAIVIQRLGGRVGYDMRSMKATASPVTRLFGVDLVADVDLVDLSVPTPAFAPNLANSQVQHRVAISIADMPDFDSFPHLRTLVLSGARVSDESLVHIKRLSELHCLFLDRTPITDTGLVPLKDLRNLRTLHLGQTQITGQGLVNLRKLQHLEILSLGKTKVDDAALEYLRYFPTLAILNLDGTNVSDAGMDYLKNLPNLRALYVSRTEVTRAGIEALKRHLPHLRTSK